MVGCQSASKTLQESCPANLSQRCISVKPVPKEGGVISAYRQQEEQRSCYLAEVKCCRLRHCAQNTCISSFKDRAALGLSAQE